jgi:LacI family transcriptional regulator
VARHVTIIEIANRLGVDTGTVSRVLSGKAKQYRISKARAERILATAKEMGYVPNSLANCFRTGRFNCVAMLISPQPGQSYFSKNFFYGIDDALAEQDQHLVVAKLPEDELLRKGQRPKVLRTLVADGLLVNYTHNIPSTLEPILRRQKLPVVWINQKREHNAVYADEYGAACQLVQHLLQLGHQRIAYVDPWYDPGNIHFSRLDRAAGYRDTMVHAGYTPRVYIPERWPVDASSMAAMFRMILDQPDRPTALISYFYHCIPLIQRVANELGITIPRDLSLVTFAPTNFDGFDFQVSGMTEPAYQIGHAAVELLLTRVNGDGDDLPSRTLPFTWVDAGSCAPPR